jgi:arylsulfatase
LERPHYIRRSVVSARAKPEEKAGEVMHKNLADSGITSKELEMKTVALILLVALGGGWTNIAGAEGSEIVHDAEYYILEAQNGERWAAEDAALDKKLAELRAKHGTPPNIIHVMWDDTSFGDVRIPAINKIRGFETPSLNRMAEEGIMFTRMYTGSSPQESTRS